MKVVFFDDLICYTKTVLPHTTRTKCDDSGEQINLKYYIDL